MDESTLPEIQNQLIDIRTDTMIQVILLGVILGVVTWLLTMLIDRFAVGAMLCGGASTCTSSTAVAGNIALVVTAFGALFGLVRLGVYRPLLVAIAASIVLWGLSGWLVGLMWYEVLAWTVLLYTLTYAALVWLVRPKLFLAAVILVLMVVVLTRILPILS